MVVIKVKILVAEGRESARQVLDQSLSEEVFYKRFASDGLEALELYHSWKPDMVLLDTSLSGVSSCEIVEEIRRKTGDQSTIIIMQTASSDGSDLQECTKMGIQGYILKPYDITGISRQIIDCMTKLISSGPNKQ